MWIVVPHLDHSTPIFLLVVVLMFIHTLTWTPITVTELFQQWRLLQLVMLYFSCLLLLFSFIAFCWKHPSPLSNMDFRNTTKIICSTSSCCKLFVILTFEPLSQTEHFSNYELFMYFLLLFSFIWIYQLCEINILELL